MYRIDFYVSEVCSESTSSWLISTLTFVQERFLFEKECTFFNLRFKTEHKTQFIFNSEQRELSTRNCFGIFSKEIREIDEFQLKSFVVLFSNFDSLHYTKTANSCGARGRCDFLSLQAITKIMQAKAKNKVCIFQGYRKVNSLQGVRKIR